MSADDLTRIVSLVAELSRSAADDEEGHVLAELAGRYGVPATRIAADIRTLTTLGDHAEAEWLLSLSAWQQGDKVWVSSLGPFRRPVLLSPDEKLALILALALDPDGAAVAARLGLGAAGPRTPSNGDAMPWVVLRAVEERRRLAIVYAGEGDAAARTFAIEPYELIGHHGRTYLQAWDVGEGQWRLFRVDRLIEVGAPGEVFVERADFRPVTSGHDLFRAPPAAVQPVRVRFSRSVAPRVRQRYPECRDEGDGAVVVTFRASSVDWLVRRVLEYGAEAEVLEPAGYRQAVSRAVAGIAPTG